MELLIGAAAVFGLLYLLGVELMTLLSIVQMILTVMSAIFLLFFVFCDLLLLFSSKRYAAQLVGIQPTQTDENGEQKKGMMYKAAYSLVDGEQLRNWFPAEANASCVSRALAKSASSLTATVCSSSSRAPSLWDFAR